MNVDLFIFFARIAAFTFILPVFRQYKGKFFYFFLVLALSALSIPLLRITGFYHLVGINQNVFIIFYSQMLLLSLQQLYFKRKTVITLAAVYLVLSCIVYFTMPYIYLFGYFILVHLVIVGFIVDLFFKQTNDNFELNFFYVFLLLYEFGGIGKYFTLIFNLETGLYYFTITNIMQIPIALFFTFVREDSKRFIYKLEKDEEFLKARKEPDFYYRNLD